MNPATNGSDAYLSRIETGGLVQSVGCILVLDPLCGFKIVAYSENCSGMLGVSNNLMGSDPGRIFTPSSVAAILSASVTRCSSGIPNLHPVWVQTRTNDRSFYAILHANKDVMFIDLEPEQAGDHVSGARALLLSERAVSRLRSGADDADVLCALVVDEVQRITGFDRVMVHKFHKDGHVEVLSESKRDGLSPYLGLHYPATDVPQAARFLFEHRARVRMVCDSTSEPVRVIQSPEFAQPLCLARSTLRAPDACHVRLMASMGSVASLVLSILVKKSESDPGAPRLLGLVVCHHHTGPRHVPATVRAACEAVLQVFQVELARVLYWAACGSTLRGELRPSFMDYMMCGGAAVYREGKSLCDGVTPDGPQLKDVAEWVVRTHGDSTGLFTESLAEAGYPGAHLLGDAVCGMAAERINSSDGGFLFWFRPKNDEGRSLPWDDLNIVTAQALQNIINNEDLPGNEEEQENVNEDVAASRVGPTEEGFLLGSVVNAIVSQAAISLEEKKLRLVHDIPEKIKNIRLRGDEIKLQSALSGILDCIADYAPSPDLGWVEFKVSNGLKLFKEYGVEFVHLQFRLVHPGQGLPEDIIEEMFGRKSCGTRGGVGLNIYHQKIVSEMKGDVCYVRDENGISYFRIDIELKTGGNRADYMNNLALLDES